ncbi:secreted RxLR effector protein 161-like [Miscanthus floridulus]|uniref:secreted RxLR effector protein 161-like n=1 Tax=Miscanthus floridulus TaxID=154761 RepID=UPI003457B84E
MVDCKLCVNPMEERLKLSKNSTAAKVDATCYRSIVGGLRYVSRFMEDPREDHWIAVKRLLCCVKGTVDQGIVFPKTGDEGGLRLTVFNDALPKTDDGGGLRLTVFSDADMADDIDGRRSIFGVLVFLGSALISWQPLKQKVVALSTCEVEYVAAATTACQAVWLCWLLCEQTGEEARPPALNGRIILEFVETDRQLANILTKPLGRLWFSELKNKIGMVELKTKE